MRIAIVNDLALAREVLRRLVVSVPGYTVAWAAEDGAAAVRLAAADPPDAILMDLVMPVMDGVEATRQIMAQRPCPILLVTSSVTGNFNKVYAAMGHGGLDAVDTPVLGGNGCVQGGERLLTRLAKIAQARNQPTKVGASITADPTATATATEPAFPNLVGLGASTGGPEAVAQILEQLPSNLPSAVVVIQHIAAEFAPSLANWLQGRTALRVRVAQDNETPRPGDVLLAGTDHHLVVERGGRLAYTVEPAGCPYRPSVDAFFSSLVMNWRRPAVAVLLTGMGRDGAQGLLSLRRAGWFTIAQDRSTSVVYGMPQAAAELNAACQVLPLSQIGGTILAHLHTPKQGRGPQAAHC
jgi:two-component system response regulator WspF